MASPDTSVCGCSPEWQRPKANSTCGTCGGWLSLEQRDDTPWGREGLTLTQMWAGVVDAGLAPDADRAGEARA